MSDEATIKRRTRKAKDRAIEILEDADYDIIVSDNRKVCLTAVRDAEVRFIRVVVDRVTPQDLRLMEDLQSPRVCKKEIWCAPYRGKKFRKTRIN